MKRYIRAARVTDYVDKNTLDDIIKRSTRQLGRFDTYQVLDKMGLLLAKYPKGYTGKTESELYRDTPVYTEFKLGFNSNGDLLAWEVEDGKKTGSPRVLEKRVLDQPMMYNDEKANSSQRISRFKRIH